MKKKHCTACDGVGVIIRGNTATECPACRGHGRNPVGPGAGMKIKPMSRVNFAELMPSDQ